MPVKALEFSPLVTNLIASGMKGLGLAGAPTDLPHILQKAHNAQTATNLHSGINMLISYKPSPRSQTGN